MGENKVHIVSFDVPFPADYGGVIDIFYRIKFLHAAGVKIQLHAFEYGRGNSKELEKYCDSVHYYKRHNGLAKQISVLPFIVSSRNDEELLDNLTKDKSPILFEGLHTTYFISHPRLNGRKKIIRLHNVEHEYYAHLALHETKYWKKAFYRLESGKLARYEKTINEAQHVVCISEGDHYYFKKLHASSHLIAGSHPYGHLSCKAGSGNFILYHGNLSVPENIKAVHYLLDEIAPKLNHKIIVTGKNPNTALIAKIYNTKNVDLFPNPSNDAMEELIENAHVHYLPSVQNTGLKLKLLYSLFAGRFVVANTTMVDNSGLEDLCFVENDPKKTAAVINLLMKQNFEEKNIAIRKAGLTEFSIDSLQKKWLKVLFD